MSADRTIKTVLLRISVVLFVAIASSAARSNGGVGSIGGRVISDYAIVPNATVRVWRDGKDVGTANVDEKGEFHFRLPGGTYEVQASAPHLKPAIAVRIIVVVHPNHETWVNLELVP